MKCKDFVTAATEYQLSTVVNSEGYPAMCNRRQLLRGFTAFAGGMLTLRGALFSADLHAAETYEVMHTDAEWRKLLTSAQYRILRQAGTERPFSSPLDHEKREGVYVCAACRLPLFSSQTKFDSGTGWPSFWKPLENAIGKSADRTFGMTRDEVHCRRCGGHLGHVFDDGPPPTGLRYCMNGDAMIFIPKT